MTQKHAKPSVTKEAGKTDKVATSDHVVTTAPEGEGENKDGIAGANPHPAYQVIGQPVSKEEYEKSLG